MDKKEIIINALRELFKEGKAGTASVSEIAKKAGIAKGGMYYYFRSKEEVLDALVLEEYENIIKACSEILQQSNANALDKLALLLKSYRGFYVDPSLNEYLHMPQNAAIHQKSLAQITTALSEVLAEIIKQGIDENTFTCPYPKEYAEIVLSVFSFLLDPGIFTWTNEQTIMKVKALADMLEKGLGTPKGSFDFLWKA